MKWYFKYVIQLLVLQLVHNTALNIKLNTRMTRRLGIKKQSTHHENFG